MNDKLKKLAASVSLGDTDSCGELARELFRLGYDRSLGEQIRLILSEDNWGICSVEENAQGRVVGTVISNKFYGLSQTDRQRVTWGKLEEHLSKKQRDKIVLLLTFTPLEDMESYED